MPRASVQIRVPFPDVDSSRRIHFTAMLRYFEVAEHELMRAIGFPYATALWGVAFPRVHVACDFRGAVRYDDLLSVEAWVAHVGRSSWKVAFTARALQEVASELQVGDIVAEGEIAIVCMNPKSERAQPLPEELRQALERE
ncbi:acyl-CoA thioesterase [Ktedonobacter robiniae]|uniref:Thioesterase domain-containing protein n=1 Tax=Ktedonobacter robiniae TaxID=2778365 RepID=A0ABQ3V5P3_9CHLR|nr:thioesterase family protein [Ktedonobacter robiniae]GHO59770.1 hypothetical protein KSB_82450 [Ktedonobacter robiniae]